MGRICGRLGHAGDCAPWPFRIKRVGAARRMTGGGAGTRDHLGESSERAAGILQGMGILLEPASCCPVRVDFDPRTRPLASKVPPVSCYCMNGHGGGHVDCQPDELLFCSTPSVIRGAKHIRPCFLLCALRYPQHVVQKVRGAILALSSRGACSPFIARLASRAENASDARSPTH